MADGGRSSAWGPWVAVAWIGGLFSGAWTWLCGYWRTPDLLTAAAAAAAAAAESNDSNDNVEKDDIGEDFLRAAAIQLTMHQQQHVTGAATPVEEAEGVPSESDSSSDVEKRGAADSGDPLPDVFSSSPPSSSSSVQSPPPPTPPATSPPSSSPSLTLSPQAQQTVDFTPITPITTPPSSDAVTEEYELEGEDVADGGVDSALGVDGVNDADSSVLV